MDYRKQLMTGHSRSNADKMAGAIGDDPGEFKKIIDIIYNAAPPLPQRASWLLAIVSRKHPQLITPYTVKFINTVATFKVDGIKRNMLTALTTQQLPEKVKGKAVSTCFDFMLHPAETVAVKALSLEILGGIMKQHPELKNELKAAIEDQLPKTSAAFHSKAKKILQKLQG